MGRLLSNAKGADGKFSCTTWHCHNDPGLPAAVFSLCAEGCKVSDVAVPSLYTAGHHEDVQPKS